MAEKNYRRLIRKEDPRTGLVVPKELYDDLKAAADKNCRKLSQEILARLATTMENPEMMSRDRLMRLIFCQKLAWDGSD